MQREEFPELKMTALAEVQSANDPLPRFAAGMLPAHVKLEHKPWKGCVDLTFQEMKFEDLWSRLDGLLPCDFEVCRTAPSAAVRATVPPLLELWPHIRSAASFPPSVSESK